MEVKNNNLQRTYHLQKPYKDKLVFQHKIIGRNIIMIEMLRISSLLLWCPRTFLESKWKGLFKTWRTSQVFGVVFCYVWDTICPTIPPQQAPAIPLLLLRKALLELLIHSIVMNVLPQKVQQKPMGKYINIEYCVNDQKKFGQLRKTSKAEKYSRLNRIYG